MGWSEAEDVKQLELPPGFRFYPTDEELVVNYLCPKVAGQHLGLQIIGEVDLYKFDPWVLPNKALFGEKEWYFFSPRDRKYPNGSRPNRVAGSGYWKATGTDKMVMAGGRKVGIKKALVFYIGKAPKGSKTNWIMHEYRLLETTRKKGSLRLDDWVLCRIYKKSSGSQPMPPVKDSTVGVSSPSSYLDDVLESLPEIDDRFFSLPRMNSLKSLQDFKLTHQNNVTGHIDWSAQRPELGPVGQNQKLVGDFGFPAIPPLYQVESPSDMLGSSLEEEVDSAIRCQNVNQTPLVFSRQPAPAPAPMAAPTPMTPWLDSLFSNDYGVNVACGGFGGRQ